MTARHVECEPEEGSLVMSYDFGASWYGVEDKDNYASPYAADVRIIVDHNAHKKVHFRDASIGEEIVAYGAAFGSLGFAADGHVMFVDPKSYVATDARPIGGMSGSAILGMNGDILGMTVASQPDERHLTSVTFGITGGVLEALVKDFKAHVQF